MTTIAHIEALHAAYCAATGFAALHLDPARHRSWFDIIQILPDVTPSEITALVRDAQRAARERRPARSLLFRRFVGDTSNLEEDLVALRARSRVRPVCTARAEVLQATGRPAAVAPPASRPIGQVIPLTEAARRLREWREGRPS